MSKKKVAFLVISVAVLLSLLGGALFGQAAQNKGGYRYFSIFTEVFDLVRNNYVEAVTSDQLMDGAFSGVTDIQQEAWELVEGLAPAYGDHWWYISLLAFTRQDQSRYDDAGLLAESALECEPTSGHAVHAQTHVMYETGRHDAGRAWLDHWVAESGRAASHRAHFSWHAALHELALGDTEAVRQRYYTQLAPPTVTGVRALIDSASLLWRWVVTTSGWDAAAGTAAFPGETAPPPIDCVLEAIGPDLVDRPETPFVALHSALAVAAAGDLPRLADLRSHCQGSSEPVFRATVFSL